MAIKYMLETDIPEYIPFRTPDAYEYSETLTAASNGNTILVPPNQSIKGISVTLEITAGTGKVQATITPLVLILESEANAVWVDWVSGEISTTAQDYCTPVTAIRQVNVSGTTKLELRAQ